MSLLIGFVESQPLLKTNRLILAGDERENTELIGWCEDLDRYI
jgi:hypothetical protein